MTDETLYGRYCRVAHVLNTSTDTSDKTLARISSIMWGSPSDVGECGLKKASDEQIGGGHYKGYAIQPAEFIHRNKIGFLEGNVIKYVCRHPQKGGRQDIEKAIHYLQLLLEWERPAGIKPAVQP
jgi:hypothetical protein